MTTCPRKSAMERSGFAAEDRIFSSSKLYSNVLLLWHFFIITVSFVEYISVLSSTHEVIPGGTLSIVPGRDKIMMEGCGCFLLFQGAGKAGKAFLLSRPGQYYYNLHSIGSIFKQVRKAK